MQTQWYELTDEDYRALTQPEQAEYRDWLIRRHGGPRQAAEYPAYSDHYLAARDRRRANDGPSIEGLFELTCDPLQGIDDVLEVHWPEVLRDAHKVGLSTRQINVMALRRIHEGGERLNVQEIADIVGCSEKTVRSDLNIAQSRINRIPAFGLISVMCEVFHLSASRLVTIIKAAEERSVYVEY